MIVCFGPDVVQDKQAWRYLDDILCAVDDGWHEWYPDDPDGLEGSDWLTGRPHIRELFEKAIKATAYPNTLHKRRWTVSLTDGSDSLIPQAAACYFRKPLYVCVENEVTDGIFLNAVISMLATPELRSFMGRCDGSPIQTDHAGGSGELYKLIERRIVEAKEDGLPFRAIVFTDSDERFPGDRGHDQRQPLRIAELCKDNGIGCLVLQKKAIENYIPDEVLRGWANEPGKQVVRALVDTVCRLTTEQRDHLPMKHKLKTNIPDVADLFESVADSDMRILKNECFGNEIIMLLKTNSQHLTADGLRARDGKSELDSLIAIIIEAL
jgi:hypothetical protein